MLERDRLVADVNRVLQLLPRERGRLTGPVHIRGAFARWIGDCPQKDFISAVRSQDPTQGNGAVWYLDDEHHRPASLSLLQLKYGRTAAVLPPWAQLVQAQLLNELFTPISHGWSSVIFMTEDANATVGEHVDNEDVYTIQLQASKEWIVDTADIDWLRARAKAGDLARLNPSESWVRNRSAAVPFRSPRKYELQPGDFLAMPAFSLHEVRALDSGVTVSFNVSICQEQDWREA